MLRLENLNLAMDYKKAIVTHLADLKKQLDEGHLSEKEISNRIGKLHIHTHTSMIEGEVNFFDGDERIRSFFEYGLDQFEEELIGLTPDMLASNVTGPIHIKKVRLRSLANPATVVEMDEMIVFSDQIVGLSIHS